MNVPSNFECLCLSSFLRFKNKIYYIADGLECLRLIFIDWEPKVFLEMEDKLYKVKTVSAKIILQVRIKGNVLWFGVQFF